MLQRSHAQLRRTYTTVLAPKAKKIARKFAFLRALLWFAVVLIVGGAIFSALERDAEEQTRRSLAEFIKRMHAVLSAEDFHELVERLGRDDRVAEEMVRADLSSSAAERPSVVAPHDWDFTGACFFCFTAATTIGYGNYTPTTDGGKAFLVLYAFIAIPACLNAFAEISDRALELLAKRMRKRMVFDQRITQAFHMFDADRSGKLDRQEVRKQPMHPACPCTWPTY